MSKKTKTQKKSKKFQTSVSSINAPDSIKEKKTKVVAQNIEKGATSDKIVSKQKDINNTLISKKQSEQKNTSAKKKKNQNTSKFTKTSENSSPISQPISDINKVNIIVSDGLSADLKTLNKKDKKTKHAPKAHKEPAHKKTSKQVVPQITDSQATKIQPESSSPELNAKVVPLPEVKLTKNIKSAEDEAFQIPAPLEKLAEPVANNENTGTFAKNQQSDFVDSENISSPQADTIISEPSFVSNAVRLILAPINFFENTFLDMKKAIKFSGIASGLFFTTFLLWSLKMNRGKFFLKTGKEILGLIAFFTMLTAASLTIHYAALFIKKKLNLSVTEKITDSISITLYCASSALNLTTLSFILIIIYNIWLMLCGALSAWDYSSIIILKGAAIVAGAYASFILYQAIAAVYAISETQAVLTSIIPILILLLFTYKLI